MRRFLSASLFALFLFVIWNSQTVRADAMSDGAQKFVELLADQSLKTLSGPNVDAVERHRRFRILLHKYFSLKTIGRWVLGRYWRRAKPAQIQEYSILFENLIVRTYADRFAKLSGVRLTVMKAISKGRKDTIVYSELKNNAGQKKAVIEWRLRAQSGQFKVIDVMVAGISMGLTQRDEFASIIKNSGLGVEGLLKEMRKQKTF